MQNCVTKTLKDYDSLTKCVPFSAENMRANFGGTNRPGSNDIFQVLRHELYKI
jgi:hypothetical protein